MLDYPHFLIAMASNLYFHNLNWVSYLLLNLEQKKISLQTDSSSYFYYQIIIFYDFIVILLFFYLFHSILFLILVLVYWVISCRMICILYFEFLTSSSLNLANPTNYCENLLIYHSISIFFWLSCSSNALDYPCWL